MAKRFLCVMLFCSSICFSGAAQTPLNDADQIVDKISARERALVKKIDGYTPLAETYIQEFAHRGQNPRVVRDYYFLSFAELGPNVDILPFRGTPRGKSSAHLLWSSIATQVAAPMEYLPEGFAQQAHPNVDDLDRYHYRFNYTGRERLGGVHCLVFDLSPLLKHTLGMFEGRIWVEEQGYTIIRYKGRFLGGNDMRGYYFHFDSMRAEIAPGLWLPSAIYSEETNFAFDKVLPNLPLAHARFRVQTRFWGYGPREGVQSAKETRPAEAPQPDPSGFATAGVGYNLEIQAEDNILRKLEWAGLLAPAGPADKALESVVNHLGIRHGSHLRVRCRELLTTRLEYFTVGRTIVISRGLLDILPNEPSLAAILALGLARIELAAPLSKKYASADTLSFHAEDTFRRLNFASPPNHRRSIRELALSYLEKSPYRDSMGLIDAFFADAAARSSHLSELFTANLGDRLPAELHVSDLKETKAENGTEQLHPLPLGSRTRIDLWTDQLELAKATQGELPSRKQIPFVIMPISPDFETAEQKTIVRPDTLSSSATLSKR